MLLRTKTLGIVAATTIALGAIVYFASSTIVTSRYSDLENDQAARDVDRVRETVDLELARLDSTARDWSAWDDTYEFVLGENDAYIEANLADETLVNLSVDTMIFFDAEGALLYAKAVDTEGVDAPVSPEVVEVVSNSNGLIDFGDENDSLSGILTTQAGAIMVASRPVVTSDGLGPIAGTFVFVRMFDERFVGQLESVTKLSLDTFAVPEGVAAEPGQDTLEPLNSEILTASTVLAAVDGTQGIGLELELPRSVYAEGQKTLRYLLISLLVIGLGFCLAIAVLLEVVVVNPVRSLSRFVSSVHGRLTMRAPEMGRDEIGLLGRSINQMLESIERSSQELERVNRELELERQRIELLNHSLEEKVAERTKDLELTNAELRDRNRELISARVQAATDGLTCLGNHRSFQEEIRQAANDPKRERPLAVLMVDIDGFKRVNDRLGHQAGDRILVEAAQAFREIAGSDSVYRYGGDEFAVLATVPSATEAVALGERLRERVADQFRDRITVSVGVALYPETASSAEEAIYQADSAMYKAKSRGKNLVQLWTPSGPGTTSSAYSQLRQAAARPNS